MVDQDAVSAVDPDVARKQQNETGSDLAQLVDGDVVARLTTAPGCLPAAKIENAGLRPALGPAKEPVDVDAEDRRRDRVVGVRDAADSGREAQQQGLPIDGENG